MATTTKTIKKTTYLVSNIVSFIILESIVQTYYYLKNDNNDNALNNLISTCSNDILVISLMFYIGLNCITMMKHHMIATKIFNMSMILFQLFMIYLVLIIKMMLPHYRLVNRCLTQMAMNLHLRLISLMKHLLV